MHQENPRRQPSQSLELQKQSTVRNWSYRDQEELAFPAENKCQRLRTKTSGKELCAHTSSEQLLALHRACVHENCQCNAGLSGDEWSFIMINQNDSFDPGFSQYNMIDVSNIHFKSFCLMLLSWSDFTWLHMYYCNDLKKYNHIVCIAPFFDHAYRKPFLSRGNSAQFSGGNGSLAQRCWKPERFEI